MADFQPRFVDLVRNYTTSEGTSDFVLGPATGGYASFASALQPGDRFYYSALGLDKPGEREVGRGTFQADGTIGRDPVSGIKTDFTGGTKTLSLIAAAEWFTLVQAAAANASLTNAAIPVASRTALAALDRSNGLIAHLTEPGREGLFVFSSANLSSEIAVDPLQGVHVAPASDTSGASGAWVRQHDGAAVPEWWGAKGDCTATGVGTDDHAAIDAARAFLTRSGGGTLKFKARRYRLSQRVGFTEGIQIVGSGFHENPGVAGGASFSGPLAFDGTILVFDADAPGLIFYEFTDGANAVTVAADLAANGTASAEYRYKSARFSTVRDLMLCGGGGSSASAHGIEVRTVVDVENVRCDRFGGSGFHVDASTSTNPTPYGNADGSRLTRCIARGNGLHGFRVRGNDANVLTFAGCDAALNGGCGFLDDGTLGNSYFGCHSATNNQSFGQSSPQRAQATADCAILVDQYAGSYAASSAAGAHVFAGCYTEGGAGVKAHLIKPSAIIGGNLASSGGGVLTNSSTAVVIDGGGTVKMEAVAPYGGGFTVNGNLTVAQPSAFAQVVVTPGNSYYSNLSLRGTGGSSALGLDITAGQGGGYLSADTIVFRNAAQASNFLTLSAAGADIAAGKVLKVGGVQVVGSRQAGIANATDTASAIAQLNLVLAALRTHGLIEA